MYGNQQQPHPGNPYPPPGGYGPQTPYPQGGYPPPYGPPPSKHGPLLIAGIVILVFALVLAAAWILLRPGSDDPQANSPAATPAEPTPEPTRGTYVFVAVDDPCALLDPTTMAPWSPRLDKQPRALSDKPTYLGGGYLRCDADYVAATTNPGIVLGGPSLQLRVDFATETTTSTTLCEKSIAGNLAPPSAKVQRGPIPGLGEAASFIHEIQFETPHVENYDLYVRDDNVCLTLRAHLTSNAPIDRNFVQSTFERQARAALNKLRK
ncbi:hypothetical protein [Nocardia sp. NPDC051832]|uniref:hypothetical protein n=1 Tax=Nocardia sp. NPDC051832 TaxID=3155673 RepID=UPI00342DE2CF